MSAQAHTLNLCGVLSESKRITNAHSRHFLALNVLFLLPISFSLVIFPTLQATISQPNSIFHHRHLAIFTSLYNTTTTSSPPLNQSLLLPLIFSLFVGFLSLCAVGTITYSTIHGFYGRPVKIISSLKSLLFSFVRLCATLIVSQILMGFIWIAVAFLVAFVVKLFEILGFEIDYHSNYVLWGLVLAGFMVGIWLQVNWGLGLVIVVVESKWGYEPLRRSAYLIKGMRKVAFSMLVFFGLLILFIIWACSISVANDVDAASGWKSWFFVIMTVLSSASASVFMLYSLTANTVLYMYCKALHGELAFEIAEEFAREYVSLPFDDGKVPHVVSVVQA